MLCANIVHFVALLLYIKLYRLMHYMNNKTQLEQGACMKKSIAKSVAAYQMIRDGILSGKYLPGTRLVLADLQVQLGLGQGPVRDALMRLDKSGLVENIPFKGAIVKVPPSIDEVVTIYRTRTLVEKDIALAAMHKITSAQLTALQKLVTLSQKDVADPQKFFAHDRVFHLTLYAIAEMPHVFDIVGHLNDHVDTYLNTHSYNMEYRVRSVEHHEHMLTALHAKDGILLQDALEQNIRLGFEYVSGQLSKVDGKQIPQM